MTPKEKAEELLMKMCQAQRVGRTSKDNAKQYALIHVNEILSNNLFKHSDTDADSDHGYYWYVEVKNEINKL